MRREIDRTTYRIKDLGEQPQAKYLLRFESPSIPGVPSLTTQVWVDSVVWDEEGIGAVGMRGEAIVAQFSHDHTWFIIARENIDILTVGDIYEQEKANIAEREATKRSMIQAYQEAQDETSRPTPKGPAPKPAEPTDWDRAFRDELGEDLA